jgi:TonB family protein
MKGKKPNGSKAVIWIASLGVALFLAVIIASVVVISGSDSGKKKRRSSQAVTLIKPLPPLKEKEKPPEPEVKNEPVVQKVKEVELREVPVEAAQRPEQGPDKPAGEDLGVDSDGTAGSDGFGLVARKGGTPLTTIGGGGGGGGQGASLMAKYGWYTAMLQEALRKKVMDCLGRQKGIPRGKHETVVKVVIHGDGKICDFEIVGSSGISAVDEAVRDALISTRLGEPPPEGMPKAMKIKITSQG